MSPVFAHGQLRLYLLTTLAVGPRHGYEIIRDLEERFDGLYSPSAGTIYPRLARLEEEGLVVREDEGRKAVYRLTDAGRAELAHRQADVSHLELELDRTVRSLADQVRDQVRGSARDLRAELADAARNARRHARDVRPPSADPGSAAEAATQLELAVDDLRRQLRAATSTYRVDVVTMQQVVTLVEEVRDEALALVQQAKDSGTRGG
jgi:DNA-binding PadR family transcriptional regulator